MNRSRIERRLKADSLVVQARHSGQGGREGNPRYYFAPGASLDYERLAGDLWMGSTLSIALGWIQENIAEPPLTVRRLSKGKTETALDHPLLDLLRDPTASQGYDWPTLLAASALSLSLDGNGYWECVRGRGNRIVQVWWRPHFAFRPVWPSDGSEFISAYGSQIDGQWFRVEKKDVVHIRRGIDPRNTRFGLSPAKAQLREIVGDAKASNYLAALMRNHAVPSVMISPKSEGVEFEREERESLKRVWMNEYGDEQAGSVAVLSVPMTVEKMGFSPKDLELGTLSHTFESKLVASLGLNTLILNLPASATQNKFSNLQEANTHAYQNCLMPLAARICRGIEQSPLGREFLAPGETLAFDWSEVAALRENQAQLTDQVAKSYGTSQAPGWLTRNEARARQGLPALAPKVGDIFADGSSITGPPAPAIPSPQTKAIKAVDPPPKIGPPDPKAELVNRLEDVIKTAVNLAEAEALAGDLLREIALAGQSEPLADAARPVITQQWNVTGQEMTSDFNRVRVSTGLDPANWLVQDPNVQAKISQAAVAFSQSTIATMAARVANTQAEFRRELEIGAFSGDPNPVLQRRLRDVFGLARAKARQVALTEMSRATHQAADQTAYDSGVVEGWDWLLSSDACPLCQSIAAETPGVKLGQEFTRIGTHEYYSSIKHPPAHPECNCTVVAKLKAEFLASAQPPPISRPANPPSPAITAPAPLPQSGQFGPSGATVRFDVPEKRAISVAAKILGRPITPQDFASLVGAPADSRVEIRRAASRPDAEVAIAIKGDGYYAIRTLSKGSDGKPIITNESFEITDESKRGSGIALEVFGRQVEQSARLGVARLETYAAGIGTSYGGGSSKGIYNGYYTWPRFGYDVDLKEISWGFAGEDKARQISEKWPFATKLSDVMADPEGRDWWKKYGKSIDCQFDLSPGSRSQEVWQAYMNERKSKKAVAPTPVVASPDDEPVETPPELSAEDEAILDRVWARFARKRGLAT